MNNNSDIIECENCGELKFDDIGFWEEAIVLYRIYMDENMIGYEQKDIDSVSDIGWFCIKCGRDVKATEHRIIEAYGNVNNKNKGGV